VIRCHQEPLFGLLLLVLVGCAGTREVNEAALSLSTDRDRQLALETLDRLPEEPQDYRIGPSDVLEVGVFQWEMAEQTKTLSVRVSEEGIISLPLIGDLNVKGKTVREVRVMIEKALQQGAYIKDPRVSVVIQEFRSKRISIIGAVKDPGTYTLRQNQTRLLDMLSLCGGLSETAGQHLHVATTRGAAPKKERSLITVDLHELLVRGDLALNMVLQDGDVISVPLAQKFFVYGYVQRPGAFDLKRRTTVLEAIAMAGGLDSPMAAPGNCVLKRGDDEYVLDLTDIARAKAKDPFLKPNDIVDVRSTFFRKSFLVLWEGVRSIFHVGYTLNN
jgi:polysaccharide export outer membrane protein